ncbi:MAG: HTH domain-containing protein [Bacteroidota bacterium]
MSLEERRNLYLRIDQMIRLCMPGGAQYLARRLNVSRSTFFRYLDEMKAMGAPICFDEQRRCYYYSEPGNFAFGYLKKHELSNCELISTSAGFDIIKYEPFLNKLSYA